MKIRKKLFLAMIGIAIPILASCGSKYRYIPEAFTTWTSEDGNLILYSQYGGQGGNGKLYKYDKYEDIHWCLSGDYKQGVFIEEVTSRLTTFFVFSDTITEKNVDKFKDVFSLTFTLPSGSEFKDSHRAYMKMHYTMHKDVLDESKIDAKYFFGYNLINKDLKLSFLNAYANSTHPGGAINQLEETNYPGMRFTWKDDKKFEFTFNDKVSNGLYYTSRSNVFLKFEIDEIFNLNEDGFFFELEEIVNGD